MINHSKPALVLVHGFPLDNRMWEACTASLSNHFKILKINLPGFGGQPLLETNTMATWADFVAKSITDSGLSGPVHLCGLSMGGYISLEFADRYPNRLASLILCDTKTLTDSDQARQARLDMAAKLISDDDSTAANINTETTVSQIASQMLAKLLCTSTLQSSPAIVQSVKEMIIQSPAASIATAQLAMAARGDTAHVLRALHCPVIGIVGAEDELTPPATMRAEIDTCKSGKTYVIPNAGHLPPLENPAAFATAVSAVLQDR